MFYISGYGNIAPKTSWGRIVTIFYAIFGMPLFLMWASQMGSFLAQSFQFLYSNVCCALCKRGKKRRAEAAMKLRKERRQQEKLAAATLAAASERLGTTILEVGSTADGPEKGKCGGELSAMYKSPSNAEFSIPIDDNQKIHPTDKAYGPPQPPNQQLHNKFGLANNNDSGLQSQQSLECTADKPVKIEILDPEMKDILETCARYNLDQVQNADDIAKSSEVLEEIRHAETVENIRMTKQIPSPPKHNGYSNGVENDIPTSSLPNSPFKVNKNVVEERLKTSRNLVSHKGIPIRRDSNGSFYDNSPESPLPPPNLYNKPHDASLASTNRASSSSGTPPSKRKFKVGQDPSQPNFQNGTSNSANQLVVTLNSEKGGTPVTTLLKSPALPQNSLGKHI